MSCIMRPAMLLFLSCAPCLCNSKTQIYYAQYNQMTDFETGLHLSWDAYLQRLALLMSVLELLKLRPLLREQQLIII